MPYICRLNLYNICHTRITSYLHESPEWLSYVSLSRNTFVHHPAGEKAFSDIQSTGIEATKPVMEYHGCYKHGYEKCLNEKVATSHARSMAKLYRATMRKQAHFQQELKVQVHLGL